MGRAAGGGLVACLWLWTSAGALALAAPDLTGSAASVYRSALDSFNHGDDARALTLLERAPVGGTPSEQADLFNLRGAIYLRQGHYEQAQEEFAHATRADHGLWAARFNEAEVSFRQKRYAESRRQFAALLDQTSRLFHTDEHRFVQYKLLLAGVCEGDEKPALAFIADHRDDAQPPLAWYYLNAALEHRHGSAGQTDQWLAQADTHYGAGSGRTYAESFDRLGWGTGRAAILPVDGGLRKVRNVSIAGNTVSKIPSTRGHATAAAPAPADAALGSIRPAPRTVAVVEVMPPADGGSLFRGSVALAPEARSASSDFPPSADDLASTAEETDRSERAPAPVVGPATMARSRRSHATPTPTPSASASPDASPDGTTANQGGSPTPAAASSAPASPEFMEKYEAAYVKFLEKNYPDTLALLDQADKIQAGQTLSISLRFKAHYALAYIEYRKQNYPGAQAELDLADQTQKNADSFNLRGLIFSKQHNYDQAETLFHKAVTTDPGLWAAKFNYAELPFNRGNYTDARTRFEELFSQTDATRQPREAELTQYKVFLTLLLEGKVEAASTFMDHLNFSGATPARYFCNAALNFRAGSVDKAKNWIDDARKEYPPQLVAIFIESFYRLGWMADPNAPAGTLVAQATPTGTPAVTTSGTQPTTVATATAAPSATPMLVAAASPTPTPLAVATPTAAPRPAASVPPVVVAAASPTPTPVAVIVATPTVAPRPAASASPAVALATPSVAPRPAASASPAIVVVATPTPAPSRPAASASPSPVVVAVVPTASPARPAAASPTTAPRPAAPVPPVVALATPAATPVPSGRGMPTPAPTAAPAAKASDAESRKRTRHLLLALLVGVVLLQTLVNVFQMLRLLSQRNAAQSRLAARKRALAQSSK